MFYSLRSRLIAFFVVLLVLSFGLVSYLLFNESRSIVRSYIESSALEKMDEYGSFVNMALIQIYDLSSLVFNSDITKEWDNAQADPALSEGEKTFSSVQLSKFLTQTANNYSSVSSVTIYRQDGVWISNGNLVVPDRTFLSEGWYKNFMTRGDHWVSAHTDQVETRQSRPYRVLSLLLPVGTFEPSLSKSVLKVNVSENFFLEPLNRIHLGESGTIFLLDQNGQPILSQQEYAGYASAHARVEDIRRSDDKQGVVYMRNEHGGSDIIVYKKLNPWLLVGIVSEEDLYAKLFRLRSSIIWFTTLLLVCAIVIATWLSHGITKPLSQLAAAMRFMQKGDFAGAEQRLPEARVVRNEVGYVTLTFRRMIGQLRQHIKTEFELKLLRQQAEYKALLMQINPHFLFNTLELLSSLSMQGRGQDAVQVIESLGKMLRFSLRLSEDLIPLREELQYLKQYLSILQIRFGDRLELSLAEEGQPGQRQIVKFILQPLVENAVKYSFQRQMTARVSIGVYGDQDGVRLRVADNGPGLPAELIQDLYKERASIQFAQILHTGSRHIGLRNVLARCQLYYGERFTFTIDSGPDGGAVIELRLPVQEGTADVSRIDRG